MRLSPYFLKHINNQERIHKAKEKQICCFPKGRKMFSDYITISLTLRWKNGIKNFKVL